MKKMMSVIALVLALALLCCGCAPLTAEQVVEKMNAAMEADPCSQAELEMQFTMSMDMGEMGAMEMDMSMLADMTVCEDPLGMYMDMTVSMGMDGMDMDVNAQNYVLMEDGKLVSYTCMAGEWVKEEYTDTMESMTASMSAVDLTDANVTIDDTVTEWEGQKVICLVFQVSGEDVEDALGGILEGSDTMGDMSGMDWSVMSVDGRIYVDPKTYLPLAEELTITGMGEAMAAAFEGTGVSVEISDCTASMVYVSFEPQEPIELPAEASGAVEY